MPLCVPCVTVCVWGAVLPAPLCPQFRVPHPGPARAAVARVSPEPPSAAVRAGEAALGEYCGTQTSRAAAAPAPACRIPEKMDRSALRELLPVLVVSLWRTASLSLSCPLSPWAVHGPAPPSPSPTLRPLPPGLGVTLGVTRFSQGGQSLAGRAELLGLGHGSAVPMAGSRQAPARCLPGNCHAHGMSTCLL